MLISYKSKTLTATRRKYYVTRREFLAVKHLLNTITIIVAWQDLSLENRLQQHSFSLGLRDLKFEGQLAYWHVGLLQYDVTIDHMIENKH